ncbi:hypothetical protein P152DRAFT_511705 [Eremomyces bilateralis CBS 781.70]|uniref:Uncharacterized protein n=1 Tax=Eremomyces bilateralis CBS 781.70 TaxID=1392243 RepID=A0A6G1GCE5_9PEZI|nr:uncharacterized protein P152DRAFT_511705 [Eremomyces bilateralis CBS 781.70]KAF1815570.1 hypothetical protein P152DRAFT_511705 [Eremomyces bilateralis CBS 781.70]
MSSLLFTKEFETPYDKHFESYGPRSYKDAIKDCGRKIQKDPHNGELHYWKAQLHLRMGAYADAKETLDHINETKVNFLHPDGLVNVCLMYRRIHQLLSIKPDGLSHLFGNASEKSNASAQSPLQIDPPKEVDQLWSRVSSIGLEGSDRDVFSENLLTTAVACDWSSLYQRGANDLKSRYPTEPKYIYLWLAATAKLAQELGNAGQPEHKMKAMIMGKLVARGVSDILKKTRQKEESAWKIRDGRDFRLILELAQSDNAMLLDIASSMIDTESPLYLFENILNGDIEFLWALLNIWESQGQWKQIWDFLVESKDSSCVIASRITGAFGNDYRILDKLFQAASSVEDGNLNSQLKALLERGVSEPTPNREMLLTALKWQKKFGKEECFVGVCKVYFDRFSKLETCYKDLSPFLAALSKEGMRQFDEHINETVNAWTTQFKALTLEDGPPDNIDLGTGLTFSKIYCSFQSSLPDRKTPENPHGSDVSAAGMIRHFVLLVKLSRGDTQTNETIALLALTLLWGLHTPRAKERGADDILSPRETTLVMQALALTSALTNLVSELAPMLHVMGTLLSLQLGLGDEAYRFFQKLDVKSLLFESDLHILASRLSITHPFPLASVKSQHPRQPESNPLKILSVPARWIGRSVGDVLAFTGDGLEKLYPDKLTEMLGFKDNLTQSLPAAIRALEYRRVARLSNRPVDAAPFVNDTIDRIILDQAYSVDKRHYGQLPNYNSKDDLPLQRSLMVWEEQGIQGQNWVRHMLSIELTTDLLWTGGKPTLPVVVHEAHAAVSSGYQTGQKVSPDGLAPPEQQLHEPWQLLTQITYATFFSNAMDMKKLAPKSSNTMTAILDFIRTHTKVWKTFSHFEEAAPPSPEGQKLEHLIKLPTPHFLQPSFLFLEYLQAVQKLLKLIPAATKPKSHPLSSKIPAAKLKEVGATVEDAMRAVQGVAKDWMQELSSGVGARNIRERIAGGEVGEALKPLLDGEELERVVGRIKDAAVNALEGVVKVEVLKQ